MTENKIRFAVIGCGHIGKRHAEMIERNADCALAALCDTADKTSLHIEKYDAPFFNSAEELLHSETGIDVVSVCTPNGLHAQHALLALDARKHVVIEKPMALTKASCEEILHKALQVHRYVFCVMQNRYSPPVMWIRDVLDKNILGKIYMVQINCYWNRDARYYKNDDPHNWKGKQDLDGGTLFTQFSHFIDILYWLFGDVSDIQARFADFTHHDLTDFEDSGMIQFRLLSGSMGCINYSTSVWDRNFESSLTVIAENGSVKIGGQYMNEVEYCHIKDYKMPALPEANPANDYGGYKGSAQNHNFVIENVVDTLKERTTAKTNALEGMKVVEMIERMYALRPDALLHKK